MAPRQYYHSYKLLFLCEARGGDLQLSDETTGVQYFDPRQLPALSERRTTVDSIRLLCDHNQSPQLPTAFD